MNGLLYFTAKGGGKGRELWRSDGTADGTRRVKDIRPGSAGSNPYALTAVGGRLYFGANDGVAGVELWTSRRHRPGVGRVAVPIRAAPDVVAKRWHACRHVQPGPATGKHGTRDGR